MRKGFTLVELLVVISIIAILSVIGMAAYSGVQKNARDAKRKGDIHIIRNALEAYYMENNSYPEATEFNYISTLNKWTEAVGGSDFYASGKAPVDPINDNSFFYRYYSSGKVCVYFEVPSRNRFCLSATQ